MLLPKFVAKVTNVPLTLVLLSLVLPLVSLAQEELQPQVLSYQNLEITRSGTGREIVFIPGLNSPASVFSEICAEITPAVSCHLTHLPGFAGLEPLDDLGENFLATMRDSIISYIRAEQLSDTVIVGHSLGGVLGLMIAEQAPSLISSLVIVDSLPFLPAAQFPGATVATMLPIATRMRDGINSQTKDQFERATPMQLAGMSNDPGRFDELLQWSLSSDPSTMAQAMFELYTIDLRERTAEITTPTLVFGAWAAFEQFGSTFENTQEKYQTQYQGMVNTRIMMSEAGYHFLMWDDKELVLTELAKFLAQY